MSAVLLWFVAFAVLLIFEVLTTGLVCVFFSFGALGACVLAWFGCDIVAQVASFSVLSVASMLLFRRHMRHIFAGRSGVGQDGSTPLLHAQGVVTKPTAAQVPGEVSVGGSFWRALSEEPLPEHTPVRVIGTDANNPLVLRVEKINA